MSACLNFTLYCENSFPSKWWRNDVRDLSRICEEYAGDHYSIDIVHVPEERKRALHDGVVNTPAVFLERKDGRRQNLGNMKDARKYLQLMHAAELSPIGASTPVSAKC